MQRAAIPTVMLLLLTVLPVGASGQAIDRQMVDRIRAEGLERSNVVELFRTLTTVIGPRLTASPQHREAAGWARDTFDAWGLANAHLETFEFGRGWTLEGLTLELIEPRYFPLIGYPEAWTPSTAGVLEGQPVYIGEATVEQIRGMAGQLRGAIVLPYPPQTAFITEDRLQPADHAESVRIGAPRSPRSQPAAGRGMNALLNEVGAGVAFEPTAGQHGTVFVLGNRNTPDDATPSIVLAAEHYNMLVGLVRSEKAVRVRVDLRTRYHEEDTNGYNVIAEIPGTDPAVADEIVLIGAHMDSWHSSPGGTDNADGSAAAMEAMRILQAVGARPRRTIRIGLWAGEEQGLLGARAYVERHIENDPAGRARHYVYLNDDPGAGATYGWYLENNAGLKPIFDAWLEPLRDLGVKKNVMEEIGSTDHVVFNRAGVPGYNTIKDYVDYDVRTHHTNTDFPERIRDEDLMQSAIVLAVFAYNAAMREGPLPAPETGTGPQR
jgi:carboxypeptidase Q